MDDCDRADHANAHARDRHDRRRRQMDSPVQRAWVKVVRESVHVRVHDYDHHASANVPTTRVSGSNEWGIAYVRDGGVHP